MTETTTKTIIFCWTWVPRWQTRGSSLASFYTISMEKEEVSWDKEGQVRKDSTETQKVGLAAPRALHQASPPHSFTGLCVFTPPGLSLLSLHLRQFESSVLGIIKSKCLESHHKCSTYPLITLLVQFTKMIQINTREWYYKEKIFIDRLPVFF